ncbi:MAG TPA: hypothetical protein VE093_44705 [Polyangiaceae bacterium]|jgi:hypothetical protein|nr:hypothetical protein [Polyangiaceae bacterium]
MGSRLRLGFGIAAAVAAAALIAACAWVNYEALTEFYGSGPPYYGRTTNMDKWSDPIPMLVTIDLAVLVVALGLVTACVWLARIQEYRPQGGSPEEQRAAEPHQGGQRPLQDSPRPPDQRA